MLNPISSIRGDTMCENETKQKHASQSTAASVRRNIQQTKILLCTTNVVIPIHITEKKDNNGEICRMNHCCAE